MLTNFIKLIPGHPTLVHVTDTYFVQREIADRERGGTKQVNSLVLQIDRLEGSPYFGTLSFLSVKAQESFRPFIADRRFLQYEFLVTQEGSGFTTEYRIQPILITPARAVELQTALAPGQLPVQNGSQTNENPSE